MSDLVELLTRAALWRLVSSWVGGLSPAAAAVVFAGAALLFVLVRARGPVRRLRRGRR